ncbi:MAG TPA: hypothetical protein VMD59_19390 [Acidimicrobiales bacterium]|nr:hypothetical protein [Acidimicrobiales bacterium]
MIGSLATWLVLAAPGPEQSNGSGSTVTAGSRPGQASGRVSLEDIESSLRSVTSAATQTVTRTVKGSATTLAAAAAAGGALLAVAAYLYGRRRGRRRTSVLEIRRV